jgi:hypothetical protein
MASIHVTSIGSQAGGIFVDSEAESYLRETLADIELSPAEVDDYTKAGVKDFESVAKRAFRNDETNISIQITHERLNNSSIRLRRGRMVLSR